MKNKETQIAIIGAGTAGITVAAQLLLKDKNFKIAIIDPADMHYYQAAWTLVGAGTYNMKKTGRPMKKLIPKAAEWIKDAVLEILPIEQKLKLASGTELKYDYLIVAPGGQNNLNEIEGLKETMGKNGVCSNYLDHEYTFKVLQDFKGGNAIFAQAATPLKCGGAPQKIMYLAEEYWKKGGIREKTNIVYPTPGSVLFGVKEFLSELLKVVDKKKITLKYFHKIVKIDGVKKLAYYQITRPEGNESPLEYRPNPNLGEYKEGDLIVIPYEMIHIAPPQSAPDFVKKSPLSYQDGPNKGWMEIDIHTLQHPIYKNVFGIGDAAALPTAKTGAAIRKQAPVLVANLLAVMKDQEMQKSYEGYSSCPIVTGYGKMLLCEFKYNNVRDSDKLISKFVDTTKESWLMWLLKKYLLPFMYWSLMLKGKA